MILLLYIQLLFLYISITNECEKRGNKSSGGLSRVRRGMVQNGIGNLTRGGRKTSLSKSLKSGSVAQFLNTMTLCAIFFGMVS